MPRNQHQVDGTAWFWYQPLFIVTFLHLSGAFQDCCFQIGNPVWGLSVQPPFSVNMRFQESKPLVGGDTFPISPLTQFEASFERSESLTITTLWAALALSAALN